MSEGEEMMKELEEMHECEQAAGLGGDPTDVCDLEAETRLLDEGKRAVLLVAPRSNGQALDLQLSSSRNTSLDLKLPSDRKRMLNGLRPPTITIPQEGAVELFVMAWAAVAGKVESRETGELLDCVYTIMWDCNGGHYRTSSPFAPDKMRAIESLLGLYCWDEGVALRISERRSKRDKRTYHDIELI